MCVCARARVCVCVCVKFLNVINVSNCNKFVPKFNKGPKCMQD